jgi:hypothetical protein
MVQALEAMSVSATCVWRMHACHMRRRLHACHMRRRIHACGHVCERYLVQFKMVFQSWVQTQAVLEELDVGWHGLKGDDRVAQSQRQQRVPPYICIYV